MKIGIVTLYDDNFGSSLQAFALQRVINNFGYEAVVIPYIRAERIENGSAKKQGKLSAIRKIGFIGLIKYILSYGFISNRKKAFAEFRSRYFKFYDKQFYRGDDLSLLPDSFDKFVCGSDMLWSEEFIDDWEFFFLGFSEKSKNVAYAPSFGKNEIKDENKEKLVNLLNNIQYLSCREEAGVDLIRNIADLNVPQVIDPTLLLKREEWDEIISDSKPIIKDKYILTYVFGGMGGKRKDFFKRLKKNIQGKLVVLPMQSKDNSSSMPTIGPIEFMRLFRSAEFVVTDTFHGMIFSIIFNRPFLVLEREDGGHWAKYSDRMTSTLKMLNLENRYVNSSFNQFDKIKEIDYEQVQNALSQKRNKALEYLNNALGDKKE